MEIGVVLAAARENDLGLCCRVPTTFHFFNRIFLNWEATFPRICSFSSFSYCKSSKTSLSVYFTTIGFFYVLYVLYSTLLHLPPLRFYYVERCWDSCDFGNGCQSL
jgi:hypothetical protein